MRSGAFLLMLALAAVGCRSNPEQVAANSTAKTEGGSTPSYTLIEGTSYRATPLTPPRLGTLTAEEEAAEINLRSQPTTQSEVTGNSSAGEEVELHQLAEGEGGYNWYFVKFADSDVEGWIRGDFIDTPTATDQAAAATENTCGDDAPAAFFETDTFAIYICKVGDGLRYISTNKINQESFVLDNVKSSQGTFIAIDGNIQYHLNDVTLAVYRVNQGEYTQLVGEPIIRQQRFE